ncbi:MAG: VOC family protein [Bacteroidales bacterium]|nr:VOC family protein [Bacteroidales bacterium]
MKRLFILSFIIMAVSCGEKTTEIPECYQEVDQVLWVVTDLDKTIQAYSQLGFTDVMDLGTSVIDSKEFKNQVKVKLAMANLGGAIVTWIELLDGNSVFHEFMDHYGEGAFSLVHRFPNKQKMKQEMNRLRDLGIQVRDDIIINTDQESIHIVLMDTEKEGKYTLGFTYKDQGKDSAGQLSAGNRHSMKINQYAFAIRDPEPVSVFWQSVGLPELQINHPVLGETKYYGELVDHQLIQGWQRHGKVSYEWCIPVKPPIVYEDHIKLHGEGIHHLAFSVEDMDKVLEDFTSRGFVVSMGGTWGEKGKPGSGRYEYIDLEDFGGVTMELLWNF